MDVLYGLPAIDPPGFVLFTIATGLQQNNHRQDEGGDHVLEVFKEKVLLRTLRSMGDSAH